MAAEQILCTTLPVRLVGDGETVTNVKVELSYTTSPRSLRLTLCDLSPRLLLLTCSLNEERFGELRERQNLTVDLPGFRKYLKELLVLPGREERFEVVVDLEGGVLKIVERHAFQVTTRLEIGVERASEGELMGLLVGEREKSEEMVREYKEENGRMEVEMERLRQLVGELETERDGLKRVGAEKEEWRRRCERGEARMKELETEIEGISALKASVTHGETRVKALETELDDVGRRSERDKAQVGRLREELRTSKTREGIKVEIICKQEDRIGELEREVRKLKDEVEMNRVEKEGLRGRLRGVEDRLRENLQVVQRDEQVIAYLNRELNRRAVTQEE